MAQLVKKKKINAYKIVRKIPKIIILLTIIFFAVIVVLLMFLKIDATLNGRGIALPANYCMVKLKEGGLVKDILIKENESVKAGQKIALIDDLAITNYFDQSQSKINELTIKLETSTNEKKIMKYYRLWTEKY